MRQVLKTLCFLWLAGSTGAAAAEPPPASNQPQVCDSLIPSTILNVQGTTLLTARIPLNGNLADAALASSSGNKDLDEAALACSSRVHIAAPGKDGVPIEATWTFEVMWRAPDQGHSYLAIARPTGYPKFCGSYPRAAIRAHSEGSTMLAFVVGTDGSVSNLRITESSGSKELDDASSACVAQQHYFPMTVAGNPIAFDWNAHINWHLHD
jgi:TonB family protein